MDVGARSEFAGLPPCLAVARWRLRAGDEFVLAGCVMLHGAAMAAGLKRKRWRDAQRLRVDLNGMMGRLIGEAIRCPGVNALVVGQLISLLEVEATAGLLGVSLFSHLAVEEGEHVRPGLAATPGYEARRTEVRRWVATKEARYVV